MLVKSKVKYIQSLSHKKQRDEDRVFIAEGPKIINELLNEKSIEPVEIFALKEWVELHPHASAATVHTVDHTLLSRLSALATPNQAVGVFRMPENPPFNPASKITILLHNIQDPGNLGTIIRCADWFGVGQVVCSKDCVDVYNPKTIQSTMGSIGRVHVYYDDLASVITRYKNVPVYAATLSGKSLSQVSRLKEGMIMIGNESKGISDELLKLAHHQVTIPRYGKAESLNAAVAAGIILHALAG